MIDSLNWISTQLKRNITSGLIAATLQAITLALSYPIFLHFLGYETFGIWLILGSILTISKIGDFGVGIATAKLIAEDNSHKEMDGVQQYATMSLALLFSFGLLTGIAVCLFRDPIISVIGIDGPPAQQMHNSFPLVAILCAHGLFNEGLYAILSGLGRLDLANYIQVISRIIHVIGSAVLLYLGFHLEALIWATGIAMLFTSIWTILRIKSRMDIQIVSLKQWDPRRFKRLLRFGGGIFSGGLISQLFTPLCRLMLARFGGINFLPVFDIASRGALQLRSILEVGLRALMTEGSRIGARHRYGSGARDELVKINHQAMKFIAVSAIPMYCILFIFAEPILKLWLGNSFHEMTVSTFQVMLIATFLSLLAVPIFHLSMGMGRVRNCVLLHFINTGVTLTLVAGYAAIYNTLDPLTIAWCTAIAYSLSLSLMMALSTDMLFYAKAKNHVA